jgi:hypothetical protein
MKISSCPDCHRREFLRRTVLGSAALFTVPGAFAEALTITPPMTEGPFYPDKLPLDTDNDLVRINDTITPGIGAITHLHGKVTDVKGILSQMLGLKFGRWIIRGFTFTHAMAV